MEEKVLNEIEIEILRSVKGKVIDSFEGCPLGPGDYYGTVRLNIESQHIDVSNFLEDADVSFERGSGVEEAGTMHVRYVEGPMSFGDLVSGPPTNLTPVSQIVRSVEVVNDTVEMMLDDKVTNAFRFTQAIILHLDEGSLVIDRNIWFEVFLSANITADPRRFLRNTEIDWNNGAEGYSAVVKREFVSL